MGYKRSLPLVFFHLGFPYSPLNPIGYRRKEKKQQQHLSCKRIRRVKEKGLPPPADVFSTILSRLPARTLQKFRCVCKSWDLLIRQDGHLASQHFNYFQFHPKKKYGNVSLSVAKRWAKRWECDPAIYSFQVSKDYTLNYSSGGDPTVRNFNICELVERDQSYSITNSCNGLVGIYGTDSFYIVNPSIRKVRALPKGSSHLTVTSQVPKAGLGFDASTGEYKVVRLFHREFDGRRLVSIGCEVLTLGGRCNTLSWKLIDDPPGEPYSFSLPVVVDGIVHWKLNSGHANEPRVALSFDLGREVFGSVTHPEGSSRPWPSKSWVVELGGCLCVADVIPYPPSSKRMNVWLLKDYRNSVWVKQYVIDLMKVYKPMHHFYGLIRPLTMDNGRIVICYGQGRRDYYDPETMSFDEHEQIPRVDSEYAVPYTESMIWPFGQDFVPE